MRSVESRIASRPGPTAGLALRLGVLLVFWLSWFGSLGPLGSLGSAALAQGIDPARASRSADPVPKIVLYTMGTGELVFEKWGHSAVCVEYARSRPQSICYNYGATDFTSTARVVWDFVRGKALFWVSRDYPEDMIRRYMGYDRSLWRQVLPFTDEQALRAASTLAEAARPENRGYIYHHFFDNCSTRVRDIIDQVTDGELRRDTDHVLGPTYRDYSREGFAEMTWGLLGTDYLLARQADEQPTLWQAMFLPDFLRDHVAGRFGVEPEPIYHRRGPPFSRDPGLGGRPLLFGIAVFLALMVGLARWLGRLERLAVAVALLPSFLLSLVVWGLPIISSIEALRYNELLLVYVPVDLAVVFLDGPRRHRYAQLRIVWLAGVSLLAAIGVFTQPLWGPIVLVFAPLAVIAAPTFPHRARASGSRADGHRPGSGQSVRGG